MQTPFDVFAPNPFFEQILSGKKRAIAKGEIVVA
jgi:hypothetical protein